MKTEEKINCCKGLCEKLTTINYVPIILGWQIFSDVINRLEWFLMYLYPLMLIVPRLVEKGGH